jgi:hypothetical protein
MWIAPLRSGRLAAPARCYRGSHLDTGRVAGCAAAVSDARDAVSFASVFVQGSDD